MKLIWRIGLIASLMVLGIALAMTVPILPAQAQGAETLSAGIGKGDRPSNKDFPLKLIFAEKGGAYVADVAVTITDSSGNKVVETNSEGPWLFVKVPDGAYKVLAKRPDGKATSAQIDVGGGSQTVVFLTFPQMKG
jgi:hypothetical protein